MALTAATEDCYYFRTRVCTKGSLCPYRHCVAAKTSTELCEDWSYGKCFDINCPRLHMREVPQNYSQYPKVQPHMVQCYFETQLSGCTKPFCPYKHMKPRENNSKSTVLESPLIFTVGDSPMKDSPVKLAESVHNPTSIKRTLDETTESPKIKKILFGKIVEVDEQPTTGDGVSNKNNTQVSSQPAAPTVKTLQQIKREKILRARLQYEKRILEQRKLQEKEEREELEKREALKQQALVLAAEIQSEKDLPKHEAVQESDRDNDCLSSKLHTANLNFKNNTTKQLRDSSKSKTEERSTGVQQITKHLTITQSVNNEKLNPIKGFEVKSLLSLKPVVRKRVQDRLGAQKKVTKTAIVQPQKTINTNKTVMLSPGKKELKNAQNTYEVIEISPERRTSALSVSSSRAKVMKATGVPNTTNLPKPSQVKEIPNVQLIRQTSPLKRRFAEKLAQKSEVKVSPLWRKKPEIKKQNGLTIIKPQPRKRQLYGKKPDSESTDSQHSEQETMLKKIDLKNSAELRKSESSPLRQMDLRVTIGKPVSEAASALPTTEVKRNSNTDKSSPLNLNKTSNKIPKLTNIPSTVKLPNQKHLTTTTKPKLTIHTGLPSTQTVTDEQKSLELRCTLREIAPAIRPQPNKSSVVTQAAANSSTKPHQINHRSTVLIKPSTVLETRSVKSKEEEIKPAIKVISRTAISSNNVVKKSLGESTIAARKIRIKRPYASISRTFIGEETAPCKVAKHTTRTSSVPKLEHRSPAVTKSHTSELTVPRTLASTADSTKPELSVSSTSKTNALTINPALKTNTAVLQTSNGRDKTLGKELPSSTSATRKLDVRKTNTDCVTSDEALISSTPRNRKPANISTQKTLIKLADGSSLDSPSCANNISKIHPELDIIKSETLLQCNASPSVLQMNRSLTRLTVEHKIKRQLTDSEMNKILNSEAELDISCSDSKAGNSGHEHKQDESSAEFRPGMLNLESELNNCSSGSKSKFFVEATNAIGLSDEDAIRAFEAILD